MKKPKVAVIILCHNGKIFLGDCFNSLKKQTYSNYEIVLIDNGSSDDSVEFTRENFAWVTIISNKFNLGYATGNNIGIKYAIDNGAEYIVLLNMDTVVEKNFIEEGIKVLERRDVGMACPKIKFFGTNYIWYAGGYDLKKSDVLFRPWNKIMGHVGYSEEDRKKYDSIKETGYACGCALFVKSKVIEKIGLLDERFFLYFEDRDWGLRAKKNGFKILYFPSTTVYHKVPLPNSRKKENYFTVNRMFNYAKSQLKFIDKHFGLITLSLYIPKSIIDIFSVIIEYSRLG